MNEEGGAVTYVTMGVLPGWNPSACALELDTKGESGRRMFQTGKLIELCALGARCWDLEYGFVCECDHMTEQSNRRGPKKRWTGWTIYFSRRLGALPSLPAPTRIVPIDDLGNVIVITEEPFRFDNPVHVERAEQVFKALDHAGLMDTPS